MTGEGKIRVLLVGPGPPLVGGQAVQARRLLEKMGGEEEIDAGFLTVNPVFLPILQRIKFVRTLVTTLRYIAGLITTIPRYDVIHVFSASFFSFLLAPTPAILISRLFGKKVVLNYRSGYAEEHLKRWPRTAIPVIRMCDRVVVPSGYLVDVFAGFGLEAESVFNSVDTDKFRFRVRDPFRPRFLSNRNFEELYNVECTIRAFSAIQEKFPDASLTVAGSGPLEAELRTLVKGLGLAKVEFAGLVSQAEMARLYDSADIYLNSPDIDNMPNSILEAFASGTAVVSTNAGGIPYIVEHERNGLLVETGDHEGLAAQAVRLLEDQELAGRMAANGESDLEKYQWDSVREGWLKIYRALR